MAYSSLAAVISEKEINIEAASQSILQNALWRTFCRDFPDGIAVLKDLAHEARRTGQRIIRPQDSSSPQGLQLLKLLGSDVARAICEQRLQVALGLYHDCIPVAAPTPAMLEMTPREQILLQDPSLSQGKSNTAGNAPSLFHRLEP